MSTRGEQSSFDSALEGYKSRLQNIKASDAVDIARKIAQSDDPVAEAREAVGAIVTPLGVDMLKDGIMHKLGMKGGLKKVLRERINQVIEGRKQQLETMKKQLQDAKDRADKLQRDAQERARGSQDQPQGDEEGTGDSAGDQGGDGQGPQPDDPEARDPTQTDVADQGDQAAGDAQDAGGVPDDLPEPIDIDGMQSAQDVRNASNALKQRFNNLTPEAQDRVTQKFADDDGVVRSGEGSAENGRLTLDDYKINSGTMQDNIAAEEKAGNIKPQADDAAQGNPADVDANAGPSAEVNQSVDRGSSMLREPVSARPNAAQDQILDADPETEDVLAQGGNALRDVNQGIGGAVRRLATRLQARLQASSVPNQAGDGQVPGLRAQTSQGADQHPAGDEDPPVAEDEPAAPEPPAGGGDAPGAGAGAGEEIGTEAGTEAAVAGTEGGIEGVEAGLLASAPETGGLGAIAAGIVGIGAALASIFAPHHEKKAMPPPPPNLSTPVLQLGI